MIKSKSYTILPLLLSSRQLWKNNASSEFPSVLEKQKPPFPLKRPAEVPEAWVPGSQWCWGCLHKPHRAECFKDDSQTSEKKTDSVHVLTDVMWLQRSETGSKWALDLYGNSHKLWNVKVSDICRYFSQSGALPMCFIYFHLFVRVITCFSSGSWK